MTWLLNRWRRRGGATEARDFRLSRFRGVLLAAQRTRGYRSALERAGLCSREIARVRSIEEALHKLPCLDWTEFRGALEDFQNPGATAPAPPGLRYPSDREVRTAVVGLHVAESSSLRMFAPGEISQRFLQEIRQFEPEAIAAPVNVLMQVAGPARHGRESIPALTRAIIAFSGPEHGVLSEADREFLWRAFEVPVFEQYLGLDGSLLAWECEAHEGLHVVEDNAIIEQNSRSELVLTCLTGHRYPVIRVGTGLTARLTEENCGCCKPGPRLIGLEPLAVDCPANALAATARG
jgi:hypothetical protein